MLCGSAGRSHRTRLLLWHRRRRGWRPATSIYGLCSIFRATLVVVVVVVVVVVFIFCCLPSSNGPLCLRLLLLTGRSDKDPVPSQL